MKTRNEKQILEGVLARARRKIFLTTVGANLIRASLVVLPLTSILVALNQRLNGGRGNLLLVAIGFGIVIVYAIVRAFLLLGLRVRSALALDEQAQLQDRISSAYEFLDGKESLNEAHQVQIQDAIRHAQSLDYQSIFRFRWPRFSAGLPVVLLALLLSFFVPPVSILAPAAAASDPLKRAQIRELQELQEQLQAKDESNQDLQESLKKLENIRKQFEKGEMSERDVMLQLARLDENLKQKAAELGVENLEGEMNVIVPHLMSSAATLEAATALKENKLDKAEQELEKLADKVKKNALTKEQKRELTMNMGVCAAKLGGKENGSFGGDFAKASEALEKSDSAAFDSACKSMGTKLGLLSKARAMKMACQKIGTCKSCLGQCDSKELGYTLGLKQEGKKKGGLKAGTAASGDPFGESSRLADSYRKLMKVSGQSGEGPVESETEITEGQLSQSQINAKEVHATFAAVAEEVIEKENIPLSHRYHVKRYFQSIRPSE